ncbi:hypothetical protein FD08_GL001227 [Lentilactobacillus parakefiri DSM 10551]|nr:hypothetical protein FD08_GL001227 [Lentilactobacillus parakefiri DSM 10551]
MVSKTDLKNPKIEVIGFNKVLSKLKPKKAAIGTTWLLMRSRTGLMNKVNGKPRSETTAGINPPRNMVPIKSPCNGFKTSGKASTPNLIRLPKPPKIFLNMTGICENRNLIPFLNNCASPWNNSDMPLLNKLSVKSVNPLVIKPMSANGINNDASTAAPRPRAKRPKSFKRSPAMFPRPLKPLNNEANSFGTWFNAKIQFNGKIGNNNEPTNFRNESPAPKMFARPFMPSKNNAESGPKRSFKTLFIFSNTLTNGC